MNKKKITTFYIDQGIMFGRKDLEKEMYMEKEIRCEIMKSYK